jgi:uncharacterized protein
LSYLIDTNIILELLLEQDRADEAASFLLDTPAEQLYLSDFSVHSLGVILLRRKRGDIFLTAVVGDLLSSGIRVAALGVNDLPLVVEAAQKFNLDFDDAYQYTVARQSDLQIVSFDSDFDRTDRGRTTPT